VLFSGRALVVLGTLFNWWNATPGFTLDVVSVDSPSIEVIWVDADQPSRVVRCSQGELEFAARVTVDRGATIRSVTMPLLDDEWAANGSVERVVAEASPVGSDQSYPLEGYVVGTQGNTDHDIRLVYRIADCDQIEQMPSTSELDIAYSFHGRDRQVGLVLPERLAFIDEDCLAEDIAAGECPA
jgi:hypothetical protein